METSVLPASPGRASWQSRLTALAVRSFVKPVLHPSIPLRWQRRVLAAAMSLLPKPGGVCRETLSVDGVATEKLVPQGFVEPEDAPSLS